MALNAPYRPGDRLAAVEYTALTLLHKVASRRMVVDEVHNLLAGIAHEQRAPPNLSKVLSNPHECAIVVLGTTNDALAATQIDSQITSRLPGLELPRGQENEDFRGLLAGFERQLALPQASRISASCAKVSAIISAISGITGNISELLSRAAEAEIRSKMECITPELLQSVIGARTFARALPRGMPPLAGIRQAGDLGGEFTQRVEAQPPKKSVLVPARSFGCRTSAPREQLRMRHGRGPARTTRFGSWTR